LVLKNYGTDETADVMAPRDSACERWFRGQEKLSQELAEHRPELKISSEPGHFPERRKNVEAGDTLKQPEFGGDAEAHRQEWRIGILSRVETARMLVDEMTRTAD